MPRRSADILEATRRLQMESGWVLFPDVRPDSDHPDVIQNLAVLLHPHLARSKPTTLGYCLPATTLPGLSEEIEESLVRQQRGCAVYSRDHVFVWLINRSPENASGHGHKRPSDARLSDELLAFAAHAIEHVRSTKSLSSDDQRPAEDLIKALGHLLGEATGGFLRAQSLRHFDVDHGPMPGSETAAGAMERRVTGTPRPDSSAPLEPLTKNSDWNEVLDRLRWHARVAPSSNRPLSVKDLEVAIKKAQKGAPETPRELALLATRILRLTGYAFRLNNAELCRVLSFNDKSSAKGNLQFKTKRSGARGLNQRFSLEPEE